MLTPKQARFVEEYLIDLNGKQAAVRAGYAVKAAEVQWKMPVETAFTGIHIRGRTYCPGATIALISGECRLILFLGFAVRLVLRGARIDCPPSSKAPSNRG